MLFDRVSQSLATVVFPFSRIMNSVGGVVLAAMMFLTAADVLLRYIFNRPITASYEFTQLMLSIVIIFSLAYVTIRREHIRIDFFISKFPAKFQTWVNCITTIIGILALVLISWQSFRYGLMLKEGGDTTAILLIPLWPFAWILAFGIAIFAMAYLSDFINHLEELVQGLKPPAQAGLFSLVVLVSLIFVLLFAGKELPIHLSPMATGVVCISLLLLLLFSGMNIGLAMVLVGCLGMTYLNGINAGLTVLGTSPFSTVTSHGFSVIPLFMLMGVLCFHSGLIQDLYFTMNKWLGHLPGGLAMATVAGCAGFAAVSGSGTATVATMGLVAFPEMKRYKYSTKLASGVIAAGGSIGAMIPPSVVLIIYGILTEESIGKLFLAGFIPGVTEAIFYLITIYIICKRIPSTGAPGEKAKFTEKIVSLKGTWGVIALFVIVLGGIYTGIFTPTEAAGVGAFGALVFTIIKGSFGWKMLGDSITDTARNTSMCFIILIGAIIFNYFLAISRVPFELANFAATLEVNRYVILILIMAVTLFLGCIMSGLAIMMLTVPIFFPVILALDFNPIWFGIVATRMCEIGAITPPIGINVFVMSGVAKDVPIGTIFQGIFPFLIADFFHVVMLVAFPQISLFLPGLLE
jgi:tripartite ATP-independent transporter DctM subunit